MGWTKREFINQAFEEIGLAAHVYDITPEQLWSALRKLDAMMASWNATGVRIGWALPASPDTSDIDEQTNAPDAANEAIYTNLAVRLAAAYGKVAPPELKGLAYSSYRNLLIQTSDQPIQRQYPTSMPAGAGNKTRGVWLYQPNDTALQAGNDSIITLE